MPPSPTNMSAAGADYSANVRGAHAHSCAGTSGSSLTACASQSAALPASRLPLRSRAKKTRGTDVAEAAVAAAPSSAAKSFGAPAYRGYVLLLLTLVYTLNFIDRNLLSVIAQPVIEAFHLSDSEYGFLNGPPFAIFYALMGIPIAMAADRYNRVAIVGLCIAIWSVMAALCGFATSFLFLLTARIGVAIGEAGCTPPANSLIGDYFRPSSRANALGIYATGVTIGAALANAFGGPIATSLNGPALARWLDGMNLGALFSAVDWAHVEGWRLAFIIIGAPGVIIALIVL